MNEDIKPVQKRVAPALKEFPANIKFKYKWRSYQKRVLDDLEKHLGDNHLHIIAPPGSGKTVLGLEVALRLNNPVLILAPTVAIKNQWIQRFCELFLQTENKPDWISNDIKKPKFLTASTYQGLHAACTNSDFDENDSIDEECENESTKITARKIDSKELVKLLKAQNVGTIIVDEAHHLKNEWWKSLTSVKEALNPTIVGLTATPPYDVSYMEWQRYIDLNGPVDAEISVPELVVENDLCPHQDYIYLSRPTLEEEKTIQEQRKKIQQIYEEVKTDETLIKALGNHPLYVNPMERLEWIYSNLEYYSAILIFLNAAGKIIPETHLEIVGDRKFKIPPLSFEWMEILLSFYLFDDQDDFLPYQEHREKLIHRLSRNGILERRTICFKQNQKINRSLNVSLSKLQSIDRIVDIEHDALQNDLRMVILTDYIRKEYLVNDRENLVELKKIGVMSIFEQLRRTNNRNLKLGVLTGSLIIIPKSALEKLSILAQKQDPIFNYNSLAYDQDYFIININEQIKHDIVNLITRIFEKGEIHVLIGTKSLLGEGWDAPAINSLILASFVGSFVLSNQMRGRAIRTNRKNPDKTGNIWHLVCVDNTVNGGEDFEMLKRRFRSFVGISFNDEVSIENGIGRLKLPDNFYHDISIDNFNSRMIAEASQRNLQKEKWTTALKGGISLTEEIKVPFPNDKDYSKIKSLYYYKTIGNLTAMLISGLLSFCADALEGLLRSLNNINTWDDFSNWILTIGILGLGLFGRQLYTTFRLMIKYRDISKDFQEIGETLLKTLIKIGAIQTESSKLNVVSSVDHSGAIFCHLEGGTTYEKSLFLKSIQEIIGTVDNPRYIIIRKSMFLSVLSQKDYHSVPELIGQNKKYALFFEKCWQSLVGNCELVYTRTIEGRKILLTSRINSLASEFEENNERINKWR